MTLLVSLGLPAVGIATSHELIRRVFCFKDVFLMWQPTQAVRDSSQVEEPLSRLLLMVIGTYCDENGTMDKSTYTPSYTTLAKACKCTVAQVKNRIKTLIASGELSHKVDGKGRNSKNRFTINLPMPKIEDLDMESDFEDLPDFMRLEQRIERIESAIIMIVGKIESIANTKRDNGINETFNGINETFNGINETSHSRVETPNNISNISNSGRARKIVSIPDELKQHESFLPLWKDFQAHRESIKKPMTDRAEKMILNKCLKNLPKHGIDWVLFELERSIINGWQDLYFKQNSPFFDSQTAVNQWQSKSSTGWN